MKTKRKRRLFAELAEGLDALAARRKGKVTLKQVAAGTLRKLISEGLASGESRPADQAYWDAKRRRLHA